MAVSEEYREYVLEQLGRVVPVTSRSMFGGVGIYSNGVFFALISKDLVYFKVDDVNRPDYEAAGRKPFSPYGDERSMNYFELPGELLEDPDALRPWIERSLDAARRKGKGR